MPRSNKRVELKMGNGDDILVTARMSETVLSGKIKDPELIVLNFRGPLQSGVNETGRVSICVWSDGNSL